MAHNSTEHTSDVASCKRDHQLLGLAEVVPGKEEDWSQICRALPSAKHNAVTDVQAANSSLHSPWYRNDIFVEKLNGPFKGSKLHHGVGDLPQPEGR